eukprot:jgi/Chlat1/4012/Chrsp26S03992
MQPMQAEDYHPSSSGRTVHKTPKRAFYSVRTKYVGVSYVAQSSNFRACLWASGKYISLGCYLSAKEAARAYDSAVDKHGLAKLTNRKLFPADFMDDDVGSGCNSIRGQKAKSAAAKQEIRSHTTGAERRSVIVPPTPMPTATQVVVPYKDAPTSFALKHSHSSPAQRRGKKRQTSQIGRATVESSTNLARLQHNKRRRECREVVADDIATHEPARKYVGVHVRAPKAAFARVWVKGRFHVLGQFSDPKIAALVWDRAQSEFQLQSQHTPNHVAHVTDFHGYPLHVIEEAVPERVGVYMDELTKHWVVVRPVEGLKHASPVRMRYYAIRDNAIRMLETLNQPQPQQQQRQQQQQQRQQRQQQRQPEPQPQPQQPPDKEPELLLSSMGAAHIATVIEKSTPTQNHTFSTQLQEAYPELCRGTFRQAKTKRVKPLDSTTSPPDGSKKHNRRKRNVVRRLTCSTDATLPSTVWNPKRSNYTRVSSPQPQNVDTYIPPHELLPELWDAEAHGAWWGLDMIEPRPNNTYYVKYSTFDEYETVPRDRLQPVSDLIERRTDIAAGDFVICFVKLSRRHPLVHGKAWYAGLVLQEPLHPCRSCRGVTSAVSMQAQPFTCMCKFLVRCCNHGASMDTEAEERWVLTSDIAIPQLSKKMKAGE